MFFPIQLMQTGIQSKAQHEELQKAKFNRAFNRMAQVLQEGGSGNTKYLILTMGRLTFIKLYLKTIFQTLPGVSDSRKPSNPLREN